MIREQDSPRHTGVIARGTQEDFDELYAAVYRLLDFVLGVTDGDYPEDYRTLGIFSFCHDIRHAVPVAELEAALAFSQAQ